MRDDSEVQTYCDNMFLQLLLSLSLAFARVPKEIISEADNRVFDAIRQNAIDVNELRVDVALWKAAGKKMFTKSFYHRTTIKAVLFSPPSSFPIFSAFRIFCFRSMMLSLQKSNARIKDNVPENHLFCAMDCDCVAIPQSINLQITASCVRGILKMRTVL
jgi:hypothetical protein